MLSFFSPVPRNKSDPPDRPILSSLSILFCYHQGTVVKGSFLITVVRIPRAVLMYVYNTLKEKVRQHVKTECALCLGYRKVNHWRTAVGPRTGMWPVPGTIQKAPMGFRSHPHPTPSNLPVQLPFLCNFVGFSPTWWHRWCRECLVLSLLLFLPI